MDQDEDAYLYGDDPVATEETSTSNATLQQTSNSPPTAVPEILPEHSGGDTPMADSAPECATREDDLEEGEEEEEEIEEEVEVDDSEDVPTNTQFHPRIPRKANLQPRKLNS